MALFSTDIANTVLWHFCRRMNRSPE
eukprot:IDg5879t1